jgi:hypothetical protein
MGDEPIKAATSIGSRTRRAVHIELQPVLRDLLRDSQRILGGALPGPRKPDIGGSDAERDHKMNKGSFVFYIGITNGWTLQSVAQRFVVEVDPA